MMSRTQLLSTLLATQCVLVWSASIAAPGLNTTKFQNTTHIPPPPPAYMMDNQHNYYKTAPDRGRQNGPVWDYSGSLKRYLTNLDKGVVLRGGFDEKNGNGTSNGTSATTIKTTRFNPQAHSKRQSSSSFWLSSLGALGTQPHAGADYQFFRNVVTDFGADNTGKSDTAEALNAASASWNKASKAGGKTRCGQQCGNTFSQGAIVYFPGGTYKICSPVIQYYYTQFVGDPNDMPIIKGCDKFKGIALFDVDPYIPGASGRQWYINQNQFFRQIRNFRFDLRDMPVSTADNDQPLVPTGIHWQVSQATSLQNLVFDMPKDSKTTAVGVFTENGSGGFVSDLVFNGGNIGWRAGSQQYTARNLVFNQCSTAVQMIWDWGWNWQQITVNGGSIAFNISGIGGDKGQGTGSVSIIDSTIKDVNIGVLTNTNAASSPNIVLDNTEFQNVANPVMAVGGSKLLSGNSHLWATGKRYNGSTGSTQTGDVTAPKRGAGLNDANGKLYVRSRPQYDKMGADGFLIATKDGGCKNDATGDQASCLNKFLRSAVDKGKIAYFPAGEYAVGSTVHIPTGAVVQGSSWSQIMGSGFYFSDIQHPKVMVRVGNKGEIGSVEITEMLFSVRGATAGAIMMEWNVAAEKQGSAAMWDSHFRVGGALGTDLDLSKCPKFSNNAECMAASLMFRVTPQANGYFENVWAWVSDHDNDKTIVNQPDSSSTQISNFGARGMLIESQGPSWFYGGGSEHSILYNYLISGAKSIYMGHIQTESPYFQPKPRPPDPFRAGAAFPNDPGFGDCKITAEVFDDRCNYAWGLQIVDSQDVMIHSAGLYSFFNEYYQDCIDTNNCQDRILEVRGSTGVVIYNLFTVATVNIASGIDKTNVPQAGNQRGFTTEVSVWVPLPGSDHVDIVWVDDGIWNKPTVSCPTATGCMLILPTRDLPSPTVIKPKNYTTSFEYGTVGGGGDFVTEITTVTIYITPITVGGMPYSNYNVSTSGPVPITVEPSIEIPPSTIPLPDGKGGSTPRVVALPPWPKIGGDNMPFINPGKLQPPPTGGDGVGAPPDTTYYTPVSTPVTAGGPTVITVNFPPSVGAVTVDCPAKTSIVFNTPPVAVATTCTNSGALTLLFACPSTRILTFLAPTTVMATIDCSLITSWSSGSQSTTPTPLPTYFQWPDWAYDLIIPEDKERDDQEEDNGGVHVPCKIWFFFLCISWPDLTIRSWYWRLSPGIYPPGPPPIPLLRLPPGINLKDPLPPWPKITIGRDRRITTESKPDECETRTAEACTTTNFLSSSKTTSSKTQCETISGCSISVSDSTTEVIGTQTAAPVGTFPQEKWETGNLGQAYTDSVYNAVKSRLARNRRNQAGGGGAVISFVPAGGGQQAGPTCKGAKSTDCGGTICSGYYCQPTPPPYPPPGYRDPKDPNSDGFNAPTSHVGGTTTTTTTTTSKDPTPTSPLSRGPINCFKESDFPGHADIQSGDQDSFSVDFSGLKTSDQTLGPGDPPVTLRKTDSHGVNYDYKAEWITSCKTTVDRQSFQYPLGQSQSLITAYLLVREDYTKCANGGVGGSCQVGCLLYTFTGGLGDPPGGGDPCKGFSCSGCGTPFDPPECQSCCKGKKKVAGTGSTTTSVSGGGESRNGTVFIPAGQVGNGGQPGPAVVPLLS